MAAAKRASRKRARTRANTAMTRAGKTTRTKRQKPRGDLTEASARTRAAVAADIRRVLTKHGIAGKLVELRVEPDVAAGTARVRTTASRARRDRKPAVRAPIPPPPPCPPGQIRRVVCFFRDGTFVCEERCVPL
jgi:hypothetical protein